MPDQSFIKAHSPIQSFLEGTTPVFILTGAAGTGKTYLIGQFANDLIEKKRQVVLLAPTGRAARVLSEKTGLPASTIHSKIYALKSDHQETQSDDMFTLHFGLKRNPDDKDAIYIVDESSMISDAESNQDYLQFGGGRLLSDFLYYTGVSSDYDSEYRRQIMFVGDTAQLPPVGSTQSPALNSEYLEEAYKLDCEEHTLTTVYRQAEGSTILNNAIAIRDCIEEKMFRLPAIEMGADVESVNMFYIKVWRELVASKQHKQSILITSTNAGALFFNKAMRKVLFNNYAEDLKKGDRLMVVSNNLFHQRFNGDLGTIVDMSPDKEVKEMHLKGLEFPVTLVFRSVSLAFDSDGSDAPPLECQILENLLYSQKSALDSIHLRAIRAEVEKRKNLQFPNKKLKKKSADDYRAQKEEYENAITTDPYYNALQVKFGYAVTCHKAQGGEWDNVFVDFRRNGGQSDEEYLRWVYTALTRAKKKVYTIYAPEVQSASDRVKEDVDFYQPQPQDDFS